MKKQELRLGNLVEYPGWNKDGTQAIFKVRDIFWEGDKIALTNGIIQLPNTSIDFIEPIPLTEEWLVKFGFEKYGLMHNSYRKNPFIVEEGFITNDYYTFRKIINKEESILLKEFNYVHQLQNLFWVLCGKELTLKQ
jgi:hypothetical protein